MKIDERSRQDLIQLLRRVGVYLGTFVLGGIVTFTYSYSSLHGAKNWKLGYLEEKVAAKQLRVEEIEQELATLKTAPTDVDGEDSLERVQQKLASANTNAGDLEKKLSRTEKKVKELERSRNNWKAKYTKADKSRAELALELEAMDNMAANAAALSAREKEASSPPPASTADDSEELQSPWPVARDLAEEFGQSLAHIDQQDSLSGSGDSMSSSASPAQRPPVDAFADPGDPPPPADTH